MQQMTLAQAMQFADQIRREGRVAEAIAVCQQARDAHPGEAYAWNMLGICLSDAGRLSDASEAFEGAVRIDPTYAGAWANLALAREKLKDWDGAIAARQKAIELKPAVAEHWHRLGACFVMKKDHRAAIEALMKSVEIDPQETAYRDLVLAMCLDERLEQAEELLFKRIGESGRADPEAVHTLVGALDRRGKLEAGLEIWRRVAEMDPRSYEARGQWGMALIAAGDYTRGWELYEARWDAPSFEQNRRLDAGREWGREPVGRPDVSGKTILLYSEQGIGDAIQFVRYAAVLAKRGAKVIVKTFAELKELFEGCEGVALVCGPADVVPKYDWHIPMMSLPHALGTTFETVPADVPYINAAGSRRTAWKELVTSALPVEAKLRVGLAWAGNAQHKNNANRSIPAELLEPLRDVEAAAYFSLQKSKEGEKVELPRGLMLIDLTVSVRDFADTAALVDNLDLVICVDTAVAHLSGAMGKEVWMMCPFAADFRWGLRGEQTPWYPTMQIFRQERTGDWAGVVRRIVKELCEKLR